MPRFMKCSGYWMGKSQHNLIFSSSITIHCGRYTHKLHENVLRISSILGVLWDCKGEAQRKGLNTGIDWRWVPKKETGFSTAMTLEAKQKQLLFQYPLTVFEVSSHQVSYKQVEQARLLYYFQGLYHRNTWTLPTLWGFFVLFCFWLHHLAFGILVPWPGMKPMPLNGSLGS